MKRILGMGNALVDIMISLECEEILKVLELPKGSMQLVDKERSNKILDVLKGYTKSQSAGGSAANTIHSLGMLGIPTGYVGVVGEDDFGGFFVRDMINAGVDPMMIHSTEVTGRAIALVTPDSERTFATFLGAAIELTAGNLRSEMFKDYDYFHIEGYLVQNHDLIHRAVKLAKEKGLTVSLDMASYNVVNANKDFLGEIIHNYVDILFANEEEARAFTGYEPEEALREIGETVEITVIKTGSSGSLIKQGVEIVPVGIIPVTPVDTTGAGDLYAAGFLYGHSLGLSLRRCGEIGALLAGRVIEIIGSKMPMEHWVLIKNQIVN